jgi:hypothetical protein
VSVLSDPPVELPVSDPLVEPEPWDEVAVGVAVWASALLAAATPPTSAVAESSPATRVRRIFWFIGFTSLRRRPSLSGGRHQPGL